MATAYLIVSFSQILHPPPVRVQPFPLASPTHSRLPRPALPDGRIGARVALGARPPGRGGRPGGGPQEGRVDGQEDAEDGPTPREEGTWHRVRGCKKRRSLDN